MSDRTPRSVPFGSGWAAEGPRRTPSISALCRELPPVVYFLRTDDDLIKIGHTTNLARRKGAFGPGWERVLAVVPGSRDDEAALHARFAEHLARGREYFRPAPDLLAHINELRFALGVQPLAA